MSALFPIINHLIQQNPEQQRELSEFAGSIICISLTGFRLTGRISEQGFLETANDTADTNITFHNSAIQKILQGGQPGVGDISLEGDLVLGMSVLPILGGLRYYPSEDLARVFGHVAAESISSRAGDIGRTMKKNRQKHCRANQRLFTRTRIPCYRPSHACRMAGRSGQTA